VSPRPAAKKAVGVVAEDARTGVRGDHRADLGSVDLFDALAKRQDFLAQVAHAAFGAGVKKEDAHPLAAVAPLLEGLEHLLEGAFFAPRAASSVHDAVPDREDGFDVEQVAQEGLSAADAPVLAQVLQRGHAEADDVVAADALELPHHVAQAHPLGQQLMGAQHHHADPRRGGEGVEDEHAPVELFGRDRSRLHGARELRGDVDREHLVGELERPRVGGLEVLRRGLAGGGHVGSRFDALEEVAGGDLLPVLVGASLKVHVEGNDLQA